jgi:hypothetical protein
MVEAGWVEAWRSLAGCTRGARARRREGALLLQGLQRPDAPTGAHATPRDEKNVQAAPARCLRWEGRSVCPSLMDTHTHWTWDIIEGTLAQAYASRCLAGRLRGLTLTRRVRLRRLLRPSPP